VFAPLWLWQPLSLTQSEMIPDQVSCPVYSRILHLVIRLSLFCVFYSVRLLIFIDQAEKPHI
jgi:hypothetical protein